MDSYNDLALSIEIGGTKLQAALGTREGAILASTRGKSPADEGAPGILRWFKVNILAFLDAETARHGRPQRIGVGFGGPVESKTGRALVSHQVAGWEDVSLRSWFEENFGIPAIVANDSNAAGWAEYRLGAGKGCRTFCYSNIGSGIGGAIVVDGRLLNGQGRGAGEIGHTWVPDWTSSDPGASRKLELLCSGWSIEQRLHAGPPPEAGTPLWTMSGGDPSAITCAMLGEAARKGDSLALAELGRTGESIGLALANVCAIIHPERIALGGGVALIGEPLFAPVRASLERHLFGPYKGMVEVVPCVLGEEVVLAGALLLAYEEDAAL